MPDKDGQIGRMGQAMMFVLTCTARASSGLQRCDVFRSLAPLASKQLCNTNSQPSKTVKQHIYLSIGRA